MPVVFVWTLHRLIYTVLITPGGIIFLRNLDESFLTTIYYQEAFCGLMEQK